MTYQYKNDQPSMEQIRGFDLSFFTFTPLGSSIYNLIQIKEDLKFQVFKAAGMLNVRIKTSFRPSFLKGVDQLLVQKLQ